MENQYITFGIVSAVCGAVVAALVVWRFFTSYSDQAAEEALRSAKAETAASAARLAELERDMDKTKEGLYQLELKVVGHYATVEHVTTVAGRIENVMEKLINRLDALANTFNQALVELATRDRNGGSDGGAPR
jgi:hypothetical protein